MHILIMTSFVESGVLGAVKRSFYVISITLIPFVHLSHFLLVFIFCFNPVLCCCERAHKSLIIMIVIVTLFALNTLQELIITTRDLRDGVAKVLHGKDVQLL